MLLQTTEPNIANYGRISDIPNPCRLRLHSIIDESNGLVDENKKYMLVKPCQSGKTSEMLQRILASWYIVGAASDTPSPINVVFSTNSILLSIQTLQRALVKNINVLRFDSKAKTSKKDEARNGPEVIGKIKQSLTGSTPIHMVTCCGNSVRLADISSLIQSMPELQFNIWIDEADVVLGTDVAECHLNKWEASANVEQIVMITATPQEPDSGLCSRYGEIQLLGNVHEAYSGEYVAFSQCQHHPEAFGKADTYLEYVDRVLTNSPMGIGEIAYLPAKTRRKTHEAMQDMLLNNNHVNAVLIINGSSKTLTFIEEGSRTVVDLYDHDFNKKEIGRVISEVYRKYGGDTKWRLAITGNLCIGRGISLHSPDCYISRGIFGPGVLSSKRRNYSKALLYQMCGRVAGNIRENSGYSRFGPPKIWCTTEHWQIACRMESIAMDLAEKSTGDETNIIDTSSFNQYHPDPSPQSDAAQVTRYHMEFSSQEEARVFAGETLGRRLNNRKSDKAPTEVLQANGENPTKVNLVHRWWGINPNTPIRMIPTNEEKWLVYWVSPPLPPLADPT